MQTMYDQPYAADTLDDLERRIAQTQELIRRQDSTVARLLADGHEVTDASRQLRELSITLAGLIQARSARAQKQQDGIR